MAVLLGPSGIGTWQQREIELGLHHQAEREKTHRPFASASRASYLGLDDRGVPLGRFLGLNTWIDLRSGLDDPVALQRLIAGVQAQAIDTIAHDPRLAGLCPYRGLLQFREEDAGLFFGRRRYIDELVQKVRQRSPPTWSPWWVVRGAASPRSSMLACCLRSVRSFIDQGNARVGALIALDVIPASRRDDDRRHIPQAAVALAHAVSLPFETMRLRGHDEGVYSVAFSPDGQRIVSAQRTRCCPGGTLAT